MPDTIPPEVEQDNPPSPADEPPEDDEALSPEADQGESTEADGPSPVDLLTAERDRFKEQLLRIAADFDNFRKRTRRDLENAEIRGTEAALQDLLPVVDNLERAVQAANDTQDIKSLLEGIQMVLKLFEDGSRRLGIKRIATVGQAFDPNVHEALQQEATAEHPPGTIVAEVQPGYSIGPRILRAALVVVARPPEPTNPSIERPTIPDESHIEGPADETAKTKRPAEA